MKRILCLMLSLILAVSVFFNMGICVNGVAAEEKNASEFAEEIGIMLENAATNSEPVIEGKSIESDIDFSTCRLIVRTAGRLNTLNAVSFVNGYDNIWILQFDSIENTYSAYEFYSKQNYIDFVEPDKTISAADAGDFLLSEGTNKSSNLSWGPEYLGIDKFNESIINSGKSLADITVAVIDSGVESTHEFLKGRIIPTNINTSGSGQRNSSEDDYGHGTQVAGVIVDSTLGNVFIRSYKVLDRFGQGTLVSLAAGINCAANDDVDIINISLGFYETSEFLEEAINNAMANDITIVGAAGNSSTDKPYYPSSYKGVIRVSAVNESGIIANFSNYGDITFAAPGVNIRTTSIGNGYVTCNGTSFSAPFCVAVAAAIKTIVPLASSEDIFDIMKIYSVNHIYQNSEAEMGNGIIFAPQNYEENLSGKTNAPEISYNSVFISENPFISINSFELEITEKTPDSTIYYTTDGSLPLEHNPKALVYDDSPIVIDKSCIIYAIAYSKGKYRSSVTGFKVTIAPIISEDELTINSEGIITEYRGNESSISIPKTVDSIPVIGIGDNVFKDKNLNTVVIPSDVVSLGNSTFENCKNLETVFARNIVSIGDNCFKNCVLAGSFNFEKLSSIGKSSFENVCSSSYEYYGLSFYMNLEKISSIPENAFRNSAICEIVSERILSIGKNAFNGCDALVNVDFGYCSSVPEGCFKGCSSLKKISIGGLATVSSSCFADCPMIKQVNLPDALLLLPLSFKNNISLQYIALPKVTSMFSNAFSGCDSMLEINLPSLEYFEDNPSDAPELPGNLMLFNAPKMKKTVSNMFEKTPGISTINLCGATDIAAFTFRGCYNIKRLNLQNVIEIQENVFAECSAEIIDLSNLETAHSLPDNSGIMISGKFIESTYTSKNLKIYSAPSVFIERYAEYKGYEFIPLPFITNDIPQYIASSSELININAIGYNLEYQWYSNTVNSTEGGKAIEGATYSSYLFTNEDTSPFYYCIVKQNDLGNISEVRTAVIIKDTTPADYTEYEKAVKKANSIDRNIYIDTSVLDHALSKNVYGRYACEQNIVDEQTQRILDAIEALEMNVAKNIYLFSSETDLYIFDGIQALVMILPEGAIYDNIEWTSSNNKAFMVNNAGFVRCVGNGKATITATVHNPDGSTACASLDFEKKLLGIEKVLSFLFGWYYILISKIPVKIPVQFY